MPPHETYIEPCMGSAEVFFRKPPADREIINDYNGDLVNLFRVMQDNQNLDKVIDVRYVSYSPSEKGVRVQGERILLTEKDFGEVNYR